MYCSNIKTIWAERMITFIYIETREPKQRLIDRCLSVIPGSKVQLWTDTRQFNLERCENKSIPEKMLSAGSYGVFAMYLSEFIQTELLNHIDTPHFITVQNDGYPINISSWNDSFLAYDYVGAPVCWHDWKHLVKVPFDDFYEHGLWEVGNGGFSLRSKAIMQAAGNLVKRKYGSSYYALWEDFLICKVLRKELEAEGFKFAPFEVAVNFSCEQYDEFKQNKPFGFHAGQKVDVILPRELDLI